MSHDEIVVSVIQETPVHFKKRDSLEVAMAAIETAATAGSQLVLLPESFIPGYPRGLTFGALVGSRSEEGRDLFQLYSDQSIEIPGPEIDELVKLSKSKNIIIGIGVTEKDRISGTLYCTLVYIEPEIGYAGKHRKLKPTASERIIWGEGEGSTLKVLETKCGRIGGLICWENYMPLARMALYQQGIQIYLAPTADARETWITTLRHIALEGRCFVLGSNQYVHMPEYRDLPGFSAEAHREIVCRGGSVIISPMGEILAGPLWDQSGILTVSADLNAITRSKLDFDPIGHYNRPDVFQFNVLKPDPEK